MANTIRKSLQWFFLLITVICSPHFSVAQIFESFSDGDFSTDPVWLGDTNYFRVNENGILQLSSNGAGLSLLATQNRISNNCEWQFYIRLSFSPSANNHARVYLSSDNEDLKSDLNGYFLQFGESGSGDAIELFKQTGQSLSSICRAEESAIAKSFKLKVKVVHKIDGTWEIYTDKLDGNGYYFETSGIDNELINSNYFGFYCKYTSSNAEKFYFDDILINSLSDPIKLDSIPPQISSFSCIAENELEVVFNENVLEESAQNSSNYLVSEGIGNPDSISFIDNNKINLFFKNAFENRKPYSLSVKNISDLELNQLRDTILFFSYFEALPLEVVFNEIMDDPTPAVGLPECEYLELFNNSFFDINLNAWCLEINGKRKFFEEFVFPAKSYLILCRHADKESLSEYGKVYSFSSFSLPNSGSELILRNKKEVIISLFNYLKTSFTESKKKDGGWALEQINPISQCFGLDNWNFSNHSSGGSPSQENSIFNSSPAQGKINSFELFNDSILRLQFANTMDCSSLQNKSFFKIEENGANPIRIEIENDCKSLKLFFSQPFSKGQKHTLLVSEELKNCLGLKLNDNYLFPFFIAEDTQANDIVINEILYQALNHGEEYIEIYNRSEKVLDFSKLEICLIKNNFPQKPDTNCVYLSNESKLFFPEMYFVLSRSPEKVFENYYSPNVDNFLIIPDMPRLVDDEAMLGLKNKDGIFIDLVTYDEKMHYPLLNFTDGVSLEKLHFNLSGLIKSNWISASYEVGFGTPAYQNSQFTELKNEASFISISPHVFSPNNDGRDDLLKIEYHLNKAGYNANVIIFNSEGVKIKQLVNNELLGTKGAFFWKGFDENSSKMTRGIYIVFVELFDLEGNVKHFKESAVLAESF